MAVTLDKMAKLAQQQLDAEHAVELAELDLKEKKEALRKLSEEVVPEAMEQLGLAKITTATGLEVEVQDVIRASISAANTPKAMAWLREHEHGKLIKTELVVMPADDKERAALDKKLAKHTVKAKEGVHNQTLRAWVREMLETGASFPQKLFGVHRQVVSKITVKQ